MRKLLVIVLLLASASAQAYIGPGAGLSFLGSLWALLVGIVLAIVAILSWPLRLLWRRLRGTPSRSNRATSSLSDDADDGDVMAVANVVLDNSGQTLFGEATTALDSSPGEPLPESRFDDAPVSAAGPSVDTSSLPSSSSDCSSADSSSADSSSSDSSSGSSD